MKTRTIIIAAIALLTAGAAKAQYNETNNIFYHSFRTPQSNMLNPAFFPNKNTFYLQLPSISTEFASPLSIHDMARVETLSDGSRATVIDFNRIVDQLGVDNRFRLGLDVNLLGFGFKVRNTFVTFDTRIRGDINLGVPVDIINTLRQGNAQTVNGVDVPVEEVVLAGGDIFNAQFYAEAALGVGHRFEPINLTVGAKAKLLYGIANINLDNTRIVINTYGNTFDRVKVDAYYELQAAAAAPFDTTDGLKFAMPSVSDMLNLGNANAGWAFDIGAKYDLGPLSFSFALLDVSTGIHWQNNVGTITPVHGHDTMTFTGVAFNDLLSGGEMNTDTLVSSFKEFAENMQPTINLGGDYWYSIPTRVNLGISYNFAKIMRAGFLFHGQLDRGLISRKNTNLMGASTDIQNTFRWNATFSFGVNIFNWMEFIAATSVVSDGSGQFSIMNNCVNPGVGFVFTPLTVMQVYFMADYVSSMYVTQAKSFNIKAGLNILIGNGGSKHIYRD